MKYGFHLSEWEIIILVFGVGLVTGIDALNDIGPHTRIVIIVRQLGQ